MATARISEYKGLARDAAGNFLPVPDEQTHIGDQAVTYTTAEQSEAFGAATEYVWIDANADAYIAFGVDPTATVDNKRIPADLPMFFGVKAGWKVSIYDGVS